MQAAAQPGLAEQVGVAARGIVRGIFEVHRERHRAGENEAARHRALLLADVGIGVAETLGLRLARIEQCPEDVAHRLPARGAAAVDQHAARRQRPAGHRLDAEMQPGELRIAAGEGAVGELDLVGLRHARREHLVLQPKRAERLVVRQRDRGHGRRFGADQHRAAGHRRPPVVAVTEIELRPVEAEAQHRAGWRGVAFVSHAAHTHQHVVARLQVAHGRRLVVAVQGLAMLVGHDRVARAVCDRALEGGEADPFGVHVVAEELAHVLAQHRIHRAGAR